MAYYLCAGLTATFVVRVESVTERTLTGVDATMSEEARAKKISENNKAIVEEAIKGTGYAAFVKAMFYGNEYYIFVTETYKDVRLVGNPPDAIGKFGGDSDNWMWPRHTGDFSLFRIYAGKDNKPADYSLENVPLKPRYFLPISLKGVQEGDFTMVMGFPGRTQEYLTSYGIKLIQEESNPYKVAIRNVRLRKMQEFMQANDGVRIQYAAKYASIANYWKKWDGENRGLKRANTISKKQKLEEEFQQWVAQDEARKKQYSTLFGDFAIAYLQLGKVMRGVDYFSEAILATEAFDFGYDLQDLVGESTNKVSKAQLDKIKSLANAFFKDYHAPLDKEMFKICMQAYFKDVPSILHPSFMEGFETAKLNELAENVYSNSILSDAKRFDTWVESLAKEGEAEKALKQFENDKGMQLLGDFLAVFYSKIQPNSRQATIKIELLQRTYLKGLREMQPTRKFYPDANSTLRFTFGKVDSYLPADGVYYAPTTTLEGIFEKEKIVTEYNDYKVPEKLRELFSNKNYGQYANAKGQMPVCFAASNHTTGGNSGSPIMNGDGELIGLNFDRNWEGTMSDIAYDPNRVRNIGADVRYILFIIDKYAGATHLVNEMKLVK